MNINVEKSFENYIDGHDYEDAENTLLHLIRTAYLAGWQARDSFDSKKSDRVIKLFKDL